MRESNNSLAAPKSRAIDGSLAFGSRNVELREVPTVIWRRRMLGDASPSSPEVGVVAALEYIQAHPTERMNSLRMLSERAGLSTTDFRNLFTKIVGLSPKDYANSKRLLRAKELLRSGKSVPDAAQAAGYKSSRALYDEAARGLGVTPSRYRRGGLDVIVRYVCVDVALGRLLMAFTERGVCSVLLGESDDALVGDLAREMPRATFSREKEPPAFWNEAVQACAGENDALLALSVDMRRDIFQARLTMLLR